MDMQVKSDINTKDKKPNKGCLWIIIANVVLWTILAILIVYYPNSNEKKKSDPAYLAYVFAKIVIGDNLKHPEDAVYEEYSEDMVKVDGNIYTVSMLVKARNTFGAYTKSIFVVKTEYDGENYRLIDFKEIK